MSQIPNVKVTKVVIEHKNNLKKLKLKLKNTKKYIQGVS